MELILQLPLKDSTFHIHTSTRFHLAIGRAPNNPPIASFNEIMTYAVITVSIVATAPLERTTFLDLSVFSSSHISGRASLML